MRAASSFPPTAPATEVQFLERPVAHREGNEIAPILERVRQALQTAWTIETMAALCRLSPRTFQRRFTEATGLTPGEWLVQERLEAAKEILSRGDDDMETIAARVGFGSATRSATTSARNSACVRPTTASASLPARPDASGPAPGVLSQQTYQSGGPWTYFPNARTFPNVI